MNFFNKEISNVANDRHSKGVPLKISDESISVFDQEQPPKISAKFGNTILPVENPKPSKYSMSPPPQLKLNQAIIRP